MRELTSANLNNDVKKLRTVEKLLMDLRLTWGEAVEINKKEMAVVSNNHRQDDYCRLEISS
jgi:flagellar protein FliS